MTPRAARLLRGALLGGVATLLAAASHVLGGGAAPSALALVVGGMFATFAGTLAVGRTAGTRGPSLARTVAGVSVAQLAFHLGFSLLGTDATVATAGAHHHELFAITAGPATAVARGGVAMWIAHLVAGVVTVVYLRRLEAQLWAVLARLGGLVVRALDIRMPRPPARAPRPAVSRTVGRASAPLHGAIARRGPPAPARA